MVNNPLRISLIKRRGWMDVDLFLAAITYGFQSVSHQPRRKQLDMLSFPATLLSWPDCDLSRFDNLLVDLFLRHAQLVCTKSFETFRMRFTLESISRNHI